MKILLLGSGGREHEDRPKPESRKAVHRARQCRNR